MAKVKICDRCKRPIKTVAVKLFWTDKTEPGSDQSDYKKHADIGPCCVTAVEEIIHWTPRRRRVPISTEPTVPAK